MDVISGLLVFALVLLLTGYFLPFIRSKPVGRTLVWIISILTVVFSGLITSAQSPLYRMIAIVSLQLLSMKGVVMVETYSGKPRLTFLQWCAFALGWFGMRAVLFEKFPSARLPFAELVRKGISRIITGILLLVLSVWSEQSAVDLFFLPELLLLVGLSFILHFGILNLSTAGWRFTGVDVKELFRSPYKSKSLNEFWGKRWNIAFSEMTAQIAYRPLKKYGITLAVIFSFLLSGLLHEIAISFPVRSGYGLPFLYFVLHAVAMYAESHSAFVKRITAHRFLSHLWVMAWLLLPMPLLFHRDFITDVLRPVRDFILMGMMG